MKMEIILLNKSVSNPIHLIRFHRVQNSYIRFIYDVRKRDHISGKRNLISVNFMRFDFITKFF